MRRAMCKVFAALVALAALGGCGGGGETDSPALGDAAGLAQSPWPKYRGDAGNTGRGPGAGAMNTLLWSTAAGSADRVEASAVIGADGTVYLGADDGKVYAYNGATGAIRWAVTVQRQGVDASAAVGAGGVVYVGAGHAMVALDPVTGAEKWRFATAGDVESSPNLSVDGTLYFGADDARLYALESSTGALRWYFDFPDGSDTDSSPALGSDGTVYIGSNSGMLYALEGRSGALKWSFAAVDEISGAPALGADGTVYVTALNAAKSEVRVYALDGASGYLRWVSSLPSASAKSVALGADGTVFVSGKGLPPASGGGIETRPAVRALDGKTGVQKWERLLEPGSPGVSAPSLGADGTVYVQAQKPLAVSGVGKLSALDPSTGAVMWEFATHGSSNSSPAIGADGTIYVGSDDGRVYAIR